MKRRAIRLNQQQTREDVSRRTPEALAKEMRELLDRSRRSSDSSDTRKATRFALDLPDYARVEEVAKKIAGALGKRVILLDENGARMFAAPAKRQLDS